MLITNGEIINQYAIDEYNGYLRIALSEKNNNRVEIYKLEETEEGKKYNINMDIVYN